LSARVAAVGAVVHPDVDVHGPNAIAERLDVPLLGRHTAMGDALVTAQVFLQLIALPDWAIEPPLRRWGGARR
jgi:DNA polymerase III epsilon subunit-like protein